MKEIGLRDPNKQEIYTAPSTTFKELGIQDLRDNNRRLGLDNEPVTVMSFEDAQGESRIYLGLLDHPFVGSHLADFFNTLAPFSTEPSDAAKALILADFRMPIEAKNSKDSLGVTRLNRLHKGDPEIGTPYEEFVEQALRQEIKAIETSTYDTIFRQAMLLGFVNSQKTKSASLELISRFRSELKKGVKESVFGEVTFVLSTPPTDIEFVRFLNTQPEMIGASNIKTAKDYWNFEFMPLKDSLRGELMGRFLEQLDEEGRDKFRDNLYNFTLSRILAIARMRGSIVAFPQNRVIFGEYGATDVTNRFLDDKSFELSDNNGIKIQVEIDLDSSKPYFPYKVTGYKFPPEPLQSALYPVIAWRKGRKGRQFLSQKELEEHYPLSNIDPLKTPDVYLGRALVAGFSEELTDQWSREMPIRGGRHSQRMMGAQVSVWVSLDSEQYPHASQLLAGKVIQTLEEHVGG